MVYIQKCKVKPSLSFTDGNKANHLVVLLACGAPDDVNTLFWLDFRFKLECCR